jgi:serine/threonine-protein kinase
MGSHDRRRDLSASLPPDTVAEGVRRLGWLALIYAIGIVMGPFARQVLSAETGRARLLEFGIPDLFGLAAVIMALTIFAMVRRGALPSKSLLDLGLVFQVVGALGLAVSEFWHGLPLTPAGSFLVPGECVWLVVFPLLVPNTPGKIFFTALIAASMGPVVLGLSAATTGTSSGRPFDIAVYFLTSTYLCAIVAYVIARVIHRVNLKLKDAREIGSYELIEQIGAGGMGEVWRAQHRLLARPAAIKLIRSFTLGESQRDREALTRRFEREARETAALGSTHTIDIYDFGVTQEGDFYYVMELLEGLSLQRLVEEFGPLDPGRAVYLLRQVCHSLGEAHARGLVHRDVKPANIMVCQLGPDADFVKVLDFGLVKQINEGQTATILSVEGTVVGTPSYMAPETVLGHADVDGRTDLYSLGCVAYFLLTGQHVFLGETPFATALAHVQNTPVPLGLRSEFKIPPALDALVMECLAKDPAARPASAAAMSERLAATVQADAWTLDSARVWWGQHQPLTRLRATTATAVEDRRVADVVRARRPRVSRSPLTSRSS